jgi:alpha-beta hydrolase superfamily lysophospholipase
MLDGTERLWFQGDARLGVGTRMGEHGRARGVAAILVGVALLVATPVGASVAGASRVPAGAASSAGRRSKAGRPGELISATPIIAPAGARGWRVLYHSRAVDGRDVAVSGVVVAPTGKGPGGGRPVVSWAHGTHGLADSCAPSRAIDVTYRITGVRDFLRSGYVVAATDYEGLGTPGEHPYLVGPSEARGVLDIARAAQQLPAADASANVLVYGHSQGGQAALFAGELAHSYAPQLHLLGVTAVAPVSDPAALLPTASQTPALLGYVVMAMVGLHAAYPSVDLSGVLTPETLGNLNVVDQLCSDDVIDYFAQRTPAQVLAHSPVDVPAVAALLRQERAGTVASAAPLLVIQGDRDLLVPQAQTDQYVQRACADGDSVLYRVYPGQDHVGARDASVRDVESWMADRLAGISPPSNC